MFLRSEAAAVNAHQVLEVCLGDRAPFGIVDFLTGALAIERDGAAQTGR